MKKRHMNSKYKDKKKKEKSMTNADDIVRRGFNFSINKTPALHNIRLNTHCRTLMDE
jgi:hypothetical protein